MDYVLAARAVGARDFRIIFIHVVPNCLAPLHDPDHYPAWLRHPGGGVPSASWGAGLPPNIATWGGMLSEAGTAYIRVAPWLSILPGLAISLAVFGINMFGDALRDVLDPRLRGAG